MAIRWSEFKIVDPAPDPASHQRLEDNTWNLCLIWAAGPEWVVATSDRVNREPVMETTTGQGDAMAHEDVSFSLGDNRDVDDDLDADLAAVGLPPRPRGLEWYLRLTDSQRRLFEDRYGHLVEEGLPTAVGPQQFLKHLYSRMAELVPEALQYATDQGE